MKGDFSRFTFNPLKNYIAVLKQQGRADLDADWNDQSEIWSEQFRQLTADLVGEFGVPLAPNDIAEDNSNALRVGDFVSGTGGVIDFAIGKGLAYVGGYQIRFPSDFSFRKQVDYPEPDSIPEQGDLIIFVEAWRRPISYVDDEMIREPALGGPDTSLRQKVIGQIKVLRTKGVSGSEEAVSCLRSHFRKSNVLMTMSIDQSAHQIPIGFGEIDSGGAIPGNLHYRIEAHRGIESEGRADEGFKWSDENAALISPIIRALDNRNLLAVDPDEVAGESFKVGDWIEVSNKITELHRQGGQMAQVANLESSEGGMIVTLDRDIYPMLARKQNGAPSGNEDGLGPRLRRWSGYFSPLALKFTYNLGRGIKVTFISTERDVNLDPGDYWCYAIRDRVYNKRFAPQKAPPIGIRKFRFPLAIIIRHGSGRVEKIIDCRHFFRPLAE
jgi:hypothetical protein